MDTFIDSLSLSQTSNLLDIFQQNKNILKYSTFLSNENFKKKLLSTFISKLKKDQKLTSEIFDLAESLEDKTFRNELFMLPVERKTNIADNNDMKTILLLIL
jgi:hypothetical protein